MPKLYFFDTGLLCRLLSIQNIEQLQTHYLRGSIFESFVIVDIMKRGYNNGVNLDMYFWRDKLGNEIDLLIETGKGKKLFEIKSGQTISSDYFKGLNYYNKLANTKINKAFVIYGGEDTQRRTDVTVLSWKNLVDDKIV
jgi:predicted AAA+ superfamily ATPase